MTTIFLTDHKKKTAYQLFKTYSYLICVVTNYLEYKFQKFTLE